MPFRLSPTLAADCLTRLGVDAPRDIDGASRLLGALAATLPTGSTAKAEAAAAGRVPPGDDPTWVAETWLARPGLGWSCWAAATLCAALVAASGDVSAEVIAARRVDAATGPVDVHSLVELRHRGELWMCDPYFWTPPLRAPAGRSSHPVGWAQAVRHRRVWHTAVSSCAMDKILRYRSFTLPLTADDVEAFCRISLTHTGVSARPRVHLATTDGMMAASVDRDGVVRLRRWRAAPTGRDDSIECDTAELSGWDAAEQAIAAQAGQR